MTAIAPIGAAGAQPSQALQQMAQANMQDVAPKASYSVEATSNTPSLTMPTHGTVAADPGFADSVLDSVYSEIDKLSSKMPKLAGAENAVDAYKSDLASKGENTNPMAETNIKDPKDEAVSALSKTFDHAIFMAMVNQVVSGVGDTSRTLIRQA